MKKILIVEDEKDICDMVVEQVQEYGGEADAAYSGQDGLEKILNENYEIVVSDICMPGLNGIDMMEKVLDKHENPPIFYIMSGFSEYSEDSILKKGAQKFYSKPTGIINLIEDLELYIKNEK